MEAGHSIMKVSVEKKMVVGFLASVLALGGMGWLSYRTSADSIAAQDLVTHTHEVIANTETVLATLTEAETEQRGYLLTGSPKFLADRESSLRQLPARMRQLRQLTADNPAQQHELDLLEPLVRQRQDLMDQRVAAFQKSGRQGAAEQPMMEKGEAVMNDIRVLIGKMRSTEEALLTERQQRSRGAAWRAETIIIAGGLLAIAVGVTAILLIHRDLELRQRAEAELRQNEERLRLMIDCVKDHALFMLDPEGRVVNWNAGAQRIKGYTAGEIVGCHFSRFYPEESTESGLPQMVLAEAAAKGRVENEGWRVRKDGSQFWANVVITAMRDPAGKLLGFVKVTRDLTERRRAEQVLEERDRFFELSRDLICVAAFDGHFKTLNPAWERVLEFSREELLARPFLEFIHPDDAAASRAEVERLASGQETVNFENRFRCRDGSWRWFAWNARADVQRQLIYAAGRDITERKRTQEKIIQLNADLQRHAAQLETANRELESFSYSVSHDLRAPLRHIDGFVKLLEKQAAVGLEGHGRRYLGIIADSARRMGVLIDDLLVFSRMGRAELRCTRVLPESLVHEVVDSLRNELSERHVAWKIGTLPEVAADPAMLRQVWANLIGNAVKYTRPRDPAEIEIGCDAANGEVIFHVRDNGVGFDMRYAHKLFGVFQRLHHSEDFEGTGIGLANVQRIIHRHGGRTWAEGKIDSGAVFYFSLPNLQTEPKG